MKTWFITGISRGLGLSLAQAAIARGDTVIGTVRKGAPKIAGPGTLHVLEVDVANGDAAAKAVEDAIARVGSLDVVVNNAGYGLLGALEEASDAEIEHLFAVDLFGPIRIIRAALPQLRKQKRGHIINVTSIAGRAPMASSVLYATAKSALEGLSAALALEVEPLGIKVTAVAPGAFRTDFLAETSIKKSKTADSAYAESVTSRLDILSSMNGKQLGDPDRAATAILKLVDADQPPVHLLLGTDAFERTKVKLASVEAEMATWESVTRSTDFPKG